MAFKGKAPGSGSGEMSRRTKLLRPMIGLTEKEIAQARQLRRGGAEPDAIADALALPLEAVEKALVQMRSPRPETTRGTLNVTLAAHALIMRERVGNEPVWVTMDRMLDGGFRHLPVIDSDSLVGIVSMRDLARSISKA